MGKYLICFLLLASGLRAADSTSYVFVFLNPNPDRTEIAKDSMERLQVGHLENINRLYNEGKLVVSGPFADQQAGGVFIFKASSTAEVNAMLATDPAISARRYVVDLFPFAIRHGRICTAPDIFALGKFPFVRLTTQKALSEDEVSRHEQYFNELAASNRILFHGMLSDKEAIVVFPQAKDFGEAKTIVLADPIVKQAAIRPIFRMWWNAPGVFCESTE